MTSLAGLAVVYDTMRRVMQARAVHGVFKMVESRMVISTNGIKLMDPATHETRTNVGVSMNGVPSHSSECPRWYLCLSSSA